VILNGNETREQLIELTGSSAGADEIRAVGIFLKLTSALGVDDEGITRVGPIWLAWAHGQLTGQEVLTAAHACVICGCTDLRACDDGCAWIVPGLCSTCFLARNGFEVVEPAA
jgi:hypothetical protein